MRGWDAIVVGAGPAGVAAAVAIHRAGGHVLLLDRKTFPRPKACAGMLSSSALSAAPFSIAPVLCGISQTLTNQRNGQCQTLYQKNYLTHRVALDAHMHASAVAAGVSFRQIDTLLKITDTGSQVRLLTATRELLTARHLIAADGANSQIRRLMHLPSAATMAFSVEADIARPANSKTEAAQFDFDAIPRGYGWCFPKGDSSNIGIAQMHPPLDNTAALFSGFRERFGESATIIGKARGAAIGRLSPATCLGVGNILFCGDAAGLADPKTGEGISHAFYSGNAAGHATCKKNGNHALRSYQEAMQPTLRALKSREHDSSTEYGIIF